MGWLNKGSGRVQEGDMVSAVKDICIFMIIVQAVLCFAPEGSYEKYIRILVGILMILRITEPVFNLFMDGETKAEIQSRVAALSEELGELDMGTGIESQNMGIYSSIEEELKRKLMGCAEGYEVRKVELSGIGFDGSSGFSDADIQITVRVVPESGGETEPLRLQELFGECMGVDPEKVTVVYAGRNGR